LSARAPLTGLGPGVDLYAALDTYERNLLLWALARCHGQQLAAAGLLRISPTTLNEKMKRLGIARPLASSRRARP
jgi:DNA-binding NtrC family response regulator